MYILLFIGESAEVDGTAAWSCGTRLPYTCWQGEYSRRSTL